MKEAMAVVLMVLVAAAVDFPQELKEVAGIMAGATAFMFIVVLVTELTIENIETTRRLAELRKRLDK